MFKYWLGKVINKVEIVVLAWRIYIALHADSLWIVSAQTIYTTLNCPDLTMYAALDLLLDLKLIVGPNYGDHNKRLYRIVPRSKTEWLWYFMPNWLWTRYERFLTQGKRV
jgi:hypothetical protein